MGFYSSRRAYETSEYTPNETLDDIMMNESVLPTEQIDLVEASMNILMDIEENHNRFFTYMGVNELTSIEESGQEFVYTEGVLDSIFNAIKSFLSKIWEKIKALFKRFIMTIDSYTKNDKDFCTKYRKEIFGKTLDSDFTFKGYKWKIETDKVTDLMKDMGTNTSKGIMDSYNADDWKNKSTDKWQKDVENFNDNYEKMRALMIKPLGINASSLTLEEFRKELHEYFRGGESEKQELDSKEIDVQDMFTQLMNSNQTRKEAQDAFKANKKNLDTTEKEVERIQKEHINTMASEKEPNKEDAEDPTKSKIISTPPTTREVPKGYLVDMNAVINDMKKFNIDPDKIQTTEGGTVDTNNPNHLYFVAVQILAGFHKQDIDKYVKKVTETEIVTGGHSKKVKGHTTRKDMNDRKSKALSLALKMINASKQCLIALDSEFLNALKERSRQYKACMIAVVHYKSKNESFTESYINESAYTRFTSPFAALKLR